MKIPLEEYIPYRILALLVLAVFYGIYLIKQWGQKCRGIQAMQIGRRKEAQTHTVETLMGIATVGMIPAQLLSITFGWSHLPANARFTGFCVGLLGDLLFLISVICMKDKSSRYRATSGLSPYRTCAHRAHIIIAAPGFSPGAACSISDGIRTSFAGRIDP